MKIEGFEKLIQPITTGNFFAEYWEKKPLLIQHRDRGYYDKLISYRDMENIVSRTDARYPSIKLVKKGATYYDSFYPTELYTTNVTHGGDVFSGMIDTDKVIAAPENIIVIENGQVVEFTEDGFSLEEKVSAGILYDVDGEYTIIIYLKLAAVSQR